MPLVMEFKQNERLVVNGAILRFDGPVKVHFLNQASLLHERQILRPDDATTPSKRLYFALQSLYVATPDEYAPIYAQYELVHSEFCSGAQLDEIRSVCVKVGQAVKDGRIYDALKAVRQIFPLEAKLLARHDDASV